MQINQITAFHLIAYLTHDTKMAAHFMTSSPEIHCSFAFCFVPINACKMVKAVVFRSAENLGKP